MIYESKTLNVTLKRPKINLVPDVVYAQVPTYERPNQLLQMDLLIPQVEKRLPAVIFVTGGAFIASNRARKLQLRMHLAEKNFKRMSLSVQKENSAAVALYRKLNFEIVVERGEELLMTRTLCDKK